MKTKKTVRANSFNSKLAAYSATATAALLVAPAAEATIQNITEFSYDGGSTFAILPPEINSGRIFAFAGPVTGIFSVNQIRTGRSSNIAKLVSVALAGSSSIGVSRIPLYGAFTGRSFTNANNLLARQNGTESVGNFVPPVNGAVTGYVGFETNHNGQTYYGWFRIKVDGGVNGAIDAASFVAKDGDPGIFGAFDTKGDTAADNFLVGSVAEPVSEPSIAAIGGLSLLALGAMGVREVRRRRSAKA